MEKLVLMKIKIHLLRVIVSKSSLQRLFKEIHKENIKRFDFKKNRNLILK